MHKYNIKFLVCILLIIFVISGCNGQGSKENEPKVITPTNLINETQDPPEEFIIAPLVKEELEKIATQYIQAKYNGDTDTLFNITKKDALDIVKSGELEIFLSHKLDKIISFNILGYEIPNTYIVIVSVNSYTPYATIPTIYHEYLYIEGFDHDWFITQIERGV